MENYVLTCPQCGQKIANSAHLRDEFEEAARDQPDKPSWVVQTDYFAAWQKDCEQLLDDHYQQFHSPS